MKKLLVVIVGPTASGKSALAMQIAKHFDAAIFSADARQFYQEMSIGTAKPTDKELSEVPHFFVNNLNITDDYTAGKYENECIATLSDYFKEKDIAILCGGSGLFVRAVLEGIEEKPTIDEKVRTEVRALSISEMQEKLHALDPSYFAQVDIQNSRRLSRALEVILSSGKTMSEQHSGAKKERDFDALIFGMNIDIERLYEQINSRVDSMINAGLENEVKSLLAFKNANAFQTVGYREWVPFFEQKMSKEDVIETIKKNTRHYAKRQVTWFKKMENVIWVKPEEIDKVVMEIDENLNRR
jgi:tRNA dimethylallyltransferase